MDVVTGAFGYIGRYIARGLLQQGRSVRTITTHVQRPNPLGAEIEVHPYDFDRPDQLTASLRGASTLYNTYWIRFEHGGATYSEALRNTAQLFECARAAGVEKVVHISVTNAEVGSDLPYYAGKGVQEQLLKDAGLPHAILRPTLVFGEGDILVNNIGWLLRRFPCFPIFGDGAYRLQPIHVEDLAQLAIAAADEPGGQALDAAGPEVYAFKELVALMAASIRPSVRLVHVRPSLGIALGKALGLAVGDILLTRDEMRGLMRSLLISQQPPRAHTRFSDWLQAHRGRIGLKYASELARHFQP